MSETSILWLAVKEDRCPRHFLYFQADGRAWVSCSYGLQVELYLLLRGQPTSGIVGNWDP